MTRYYIDFDSTLYDTDKLRHFNALIAKKICELKGLDLDSVLNSISKICADKGLKRIFDICSVLEEEYQLEANALRVEIEAVLKTGESLIFSDSIPFLKKLAHNGHEINILTYTNKEFDYQFLKIQYSKLSNYVDNIIFCSKRKGELVIDYENGVFIDDNPGELISLYNAGVSPDRLIRMRRIGAGHSNKTISEFTPVEVASFEEIDII